VSKSTLSETGTKPAILDEPPPMATGLITKVDVVETVPDGHKALVALRDLPWIEIVIGERFLARAKYADYLIKGEYARETFPDVWIGTLLASGVVAGTAGPPEEMPIASVSGFANNPLILTRESPRRVSHETAVAVVARGEEAARACRWSHAPVKVISAAQAANWNPDSLPPDPRPVPGQELDPRQRTPALKFRSNIRGLVAGAVWCERGEERSSPEWFVILASFLPSPPSTAKQVTILGEPSDQGKRWYAALAGFIAAATDGWATTSAGFPDYFQC
jgi:hypothetical protein